MLAHNILLPLNILSMIFIFITAACIGSFLNVIILRLPKIVNQKEILQAAEILQLETLKTNATNNNIFSVSKCPNCNSKLKLWHNIPILSYMILRAKCAYCTNKISWQYPLVELFSAVIVSMIFYYFNITYFSIALSIFLFACIALAVIDIKYFMLPDEITLPLMWCGIIVNLLISIVPLESSILGAIFGYMSLWSIFWIYKYIIGKEALGYGDFKLFASVGAWFGIKSLLFILTFSSLFGLIIVIFISMVKRKIIKVIPFGPAIILAALLYIFFGKFLISKYYMFFIN